MLKIGAKDEHGSEVVKVASKFFYVKVANKLIPDCSVMDRNWSIDADGNWVLKLRISEDGKSFKYA